MIKTQKGLHELSLTIKEGIEDVIKRKRTERINCNNYFIRVLSLLLLLILKF